MGHEIGHIFNLADDYIADCTTPPTIMGFHDFSCNYPYGPQPCDVSEVFNIYSGWTVYTFCQAPCVGSCS